MVEDEFYSVAQSFTQHLHYAEYIRRKKEAKAKNADTIADIARPTDGGTPMSDEIKKKYAAEDLKTRQKEGIDGALGKQAGDGRDEDAGDDFEAENSWAGTHLQDLMLSPRRVRSLVGLQKVKSSTRAAAGFSQSSGLRCDDGLTSSSPGKVGNKEPVALEETTDDDDLDIGMGHSTPTVVRDHETSSSGLLRNTPSTVRPSPKLIQPTSRKNLSVQSHQSPVPTERNHTSSSSGSLRHSPPTRPAGDKRPYGGVKELPSTESKEDTVSNNIQAKRRLIFDDFDELPELRKPSIQPEKRRPSSTNFKQRKLDNKDMGSKKSRLNEVPTFLI